VKTKSCDVAGPGVFFIKKLFFFFFLKNAKKIWMWRNCGFYNLKKTIHKTAFKTFEAFNKKTIHKTPSVQNL